MQYFIGVVPSNEYQERIKKFQQQWEKNKLPKVVEPHITVKAQGGLTPDKMWLRELEKVCRDMSPFKIRLNKPAFFGDHVLFLRVESDHVYELHRKIVQSIAPGQEMIKRYMELDDYVPHLTIGQTYWGLSSQELIDMSKKIEGALSPYPSFEVEFVRVYNEIEPNTYRKYLDVPLGV